MPSDSEPARENETRQNTGNEPADKTNQGNPDIPVSPRMPPLPPSETRYEITCKHDKDKWDKFKERAEVFGILVLVVYAIYTIKMYYANKEAADAAKTSSDNAVTFFRDDQRAWMGVTKAEITQYYPSPFRAIVEFTNSGKTPAINIEHTITTTLYFSHLPEPTPQDEAIAKSSFVKEGAVPPQGTRSFSLNESDPGEATVNKLLSLTHGLLEAKSSFLYLFGELRYDDVYGRPHYTTFCVWMYDVTNHTLGACEKHNDMK